MTNDQARMTKCAAAIGPSSLGFGHSFVIGYFVIRHSSRHSSFLLAITEHRCKLLGHAGQDFAAVGGDEDVVFQPDAAPAGQIDSWLDGKNHAGLEDRLGVLADARPLVNFQADAVAQAVPK